MRRFGLVFSLMAGLIGCAAATPAGHEPILGGPCEGCELVFLDMPEGISSSERIAPAGEPGRPMTIEGTVRDAAGKAVSGVIVYAYHTDAGGIYPKAPTRHGRLRGWARTDDAGSYRFDTIRPGAYPSGGNPEHVHMHVIEPGRGTYWIDELVFRDDPLLTAEHRQGSRGCRGGCGDVQPEKDAKGVWRVRRDIVLGQGVPGY